MGQQFRQQVVVVTGATSGIGLATASAFSREGARVVVGARRKDELEVVAARLRRGGRETRAVPCNVTVPAQVKRLMDAAVDRWGRLDVLVANAGIGLRGDFCDVERDDYRQLLETNLIGVLHCVHAALPAMLARGSGTIVIVSSVFGFRGMPGHAVYCASKAALNAFSESLRTELAPKGVHVLLACPGFTATDFGRNSLGPAASSGSWSGLETMAPELVADAIVSAVRRRRTRVVLTPHGRFLASLARHVPRVADWLVARWHARRLATLQPPAAGVEPLS